MGLAIVVPVRAFDLGKSRLAALFDPPEREVLARAMAEVVVNPASVPGDTEWFVVCDDDRIASWATTRGARPLRVSASGLNPSLEAARSAILSASPADFVAIAHADLPLAHDLATTLTAHTARTDGDVVLIAPDRQRDGSNVVVVPRHLFGRWEFRYGPGSFTAHCTLAESLGASVLVIDDARLATDVDTVDDLDLVRDFVVSILPNWTAP